ncbi:F-box/FBD/LRR-repeat protein At2g04230-like [Setaria viridis]|uniref:F-box/FBD/LRR-repeat protein At2g04230-like n=1 Tax=Setaria viridis TaxID=4556 RepID=UPI001493CF4A|nr:uncharacterized protein LOC117842734 [Setaria viridis]
MEANIEQWFLTSVYGPQPDIDKVEFLDDLRSIKNRLDGPWMIAGDFNLILHASDKNNVNINRRNMGRFRRFVDEMHLKDAFLHGRRYTWSNERDNPTMEKLDRVLVTVDWELNFPFCYLQALSSDISDHCPFLLATNASFHPRNTWGASLSPSPSLPKPSLRGGELSAKLFEDDAGVDRLSALPNDVLLRILLCLGDAAAAGRTSVLAGRWRRLRALLPELRFPFSPDPGVIESALKAHEAALSCLDVVTEDAAPESVAAWLPLAARRLSGSLTFTNRVPEKKNANEGGEKRGAFDLPFLENATTVSLDLGCLGVAVPPAGVFARLTELSLSNVHLRGPCALGDAVSSRRCPCLEKFTVSDILGVSNLTIRSDSLRHMELAYMRPCAACRSSPSSRRRSSTSPC